MTGTGAAQHRRRDLLVVRAPSAERLEESRDRCLARSPTVVGGSPRNDHGRRLEDLREEPCGARDQLMLMRTEAERKMERVRPIRVVGDRPSAQKMPSSHARSVVSGSDSGTPSPFSPRKRTRPSAERQRDLPGLLAWSPDRRARARPSTCEHKSGGSRGPHRSRPTCRPRAAAPRVERVAIRRGRAACGELRDATSHSPRRDRDVSRRGLALGHDEVMIGRELSRRYLANRAEVIRWAAKIPWLGVAWIGGQHAARSETSSPV